VPVVLATREVKAGGPFEDSPDNTDFVSKTKQNKNLVQCILKIIKAVGTLGLKPGSIMKLGF
jgi:hypothetical protein